MQFTMPQPELAKALALVGLAVAPRAALPVLGNILIAADAVAQTVAFSASNLETGLIITVPAEVAATGSLTLPARLLRDTVGAIPSAARIEVAATGANAAARLSYNTGLVRSSQATVRGIAADEFPLLPTLAGSAPLTLAASRLVALNRQSAFAAADEKETSRPALTGVLWQVETSDDGPALVAVGCDGYRLAIARCAINAADAPALAGPVIIPARALGLVDKLAAGADRIEMRCADNRVDFTFLDEDGRPAARLITQTILAKFPDFNAIVPRTVTTAVTLDTRTLANALRLAHLFGVDSSDRLALTVKPGSDDAPQGGLNLTAVSAERGQFDTDLAADAGGPQLAIAFNGVYLLEGLNALADPVARLEFTRPDRPGVIRGAGYQYVCMPMQLKA